MVKVNAPVDEGIASLIFALSQWPEVQTSESCEGGLDTPAWGGQGLFNHWSIPKDGNVSSELSDGASVLISFHCLLSLKMSPSAFSRDNCGESVVRFNPGFHLVRMRSRLLLAVYPRG
jgi:hypothetical protein